MPKGGLEPPRVASHAPQTCASTSSATSARANFKNADRQFRRCRPRLSNHEHVRTRTADPYRVKVVLYQLSYALNSNDEAGAMNDEVEAFVFTSSFIALTSSLPSGRRDLNSRLRPWQGRTLPLSYSRAVPHGAERDRTADLLNAIQALCQTELRPRRTGDSREPVLDAPARPATAPTAAEKSTGAAFISQAGRPPREMFRAPPAIETTPGHASYTTENCVPQAGRAARCQRASPP